MDDGIMKIARERRRQIMVEGHSAEHDAQHVDGSLAVAAATLAVDGTDAKVVDPLGRGTPVHGDDGMSDAWGLVAKHGFRAKGNDIQALVIAGALIAAEIDRIIAQEPASSDTGKDKRTGILDLAERVRNDILEEKSKEIPCLQKLIMPFGLVGSASSQEEWSEDKAEIESAISCLIEALSYMVGPDYMKYACQNIMRDLEQAQDRIEEIEMMGREQAQEGMGE